MPAALTVLLSGQQLARKKRKGRCFTPHCRRRARADRNYCCTCQDRKWREAHPIRYLYKNLKSHAKQRGKEFTITFAEWEAFCLRTRYHELVGTGPDCLTVDRIDASRGYHADNIRVLTHHDNSARKFVPYFRRMEENQAFHEPAMAAPGEPSF